MKNKLNEEKIRMAKLAGILHESNDAEIQVWFDQLWAVEFESSKVDR